MIILGIESSCDDTSVALIDITDKNITILAEKTASQIDIHKKYGGVIPEIAGRKHAEKIVPLVEEILQGQATPDVIAVTAGPGLMTGLLVGIEVAKTLSYLQHIPIVRVNHIEGHIYSGLLEHKNISIEDFSFPALSLIVSGGHTELVLMKEHGQYELIGKTRDDAVGEAFDKVAKLLNLAYPGGPKISELATTGNNRAIDFPRPMLDSNNFDFSFSGLKTAALYYLKDKTITHKRSKQTIADIFRNWFSSHTKDTVPIEDFCASFEWAIVDVLTKKTKKAIDKYKPKTLILGGGVAANKKLRSSLEALEVKHFIIPPFKYCMDNATMIAVAGYIHAKNNNVTAWQELEADPSWKIYN